jgi:hypothetical protein
MTLCQLLRLYSVKWLDNWEACNKNGSWPILRNCHSIWLKGVRKITENLSNRISTLALQPSNTSSVSTDLGRTLIHCCTDSMKGSIQWCLNTTVRVKLIWYSSTTLRGTVILQHSSTTSTNELMAGPGSTEIEIT